MTFIIVVLQIFESAFHKFWVRVLQIWVQSVFYKFESSPRFTNSSPVRVLQIWVQSAFYKFESSPRFTNLSPVRVLQVQSSPRFTTCPCLCSLPGHNKDYNNVRVRQRYLFLSQSLNTNYNKIFVQNNSLEEHALRFFLAPPEGRVSPFLSLRRGGSVRLNYYICNICNR